MRNGDEELFSLFAIYSTFASTPSASYGKLRCTTSVACLKLSSSVACLTLSSHVTCLTLSTNVGIIIFLQKTFYLWLLLRALFYMSTLTEIQVGGTQIKRTDHTKLLGIQIEESQEWNYHLKSLRSSLNQRLWVIRRVARQIPRVVAQYST